MKSLFTLIFVIALLWLLWPLWDWAFLHATWQGASKAECSPSGACWALITTRWEQFIYGFYPAEERWRVNLALSLLFISLLIIHVRYFQMRYRLLMVGSILGLTAFILYGGFGLTIVPTSKWGGLSLTIVLALGSMFCSLPLAVCLALGRNSSLLIFKSLCITFIELIRGVPLISILFMASVMLPLFFSQEVVIDKLLRAFIGLTLFQAAYLAEVVRAGLNSIPKDQYEAAQALGMSYWQNMGLVILPQALRIAIPGILNSFIALFKDTTLVLMIGIFDFLGIVQNAITSPEWLGTALEAYLFCALVYWIFCFGLSSYGKYLERSLKLRGH